MDHTPQRSDRRLRLLGSPPIITRGSLAGVFTGPEAQSLSEAVSKASVIVTVTSSQVQQVPGVDGGIIATCTVDVTIKQGATVIVATPLNVAFGGLFEPSTVGDWAEYHPILSDAPNAPVLLPGEKAVLLLKTTTDGGLYPESWTGEYRIDASGHVTSTPGNPFAASVDGESESIFEAQVAS